MESSEKYSKLDDKYTNEYMAKEGLPENVYYVYITPEEEAIKGDKESTKSSNVIKFGEKWSDQ